MPSQWYCKVLNEELGPISFADLTGMVRDGTIGEDDHVKRQGTSDWVHASTVVGLFRAAGKSGPLASRPKAPEVAEKASEAPKKKAAAVARSEPASGRAVTRFHFPSAMYGAGFVSLIVAIVVFVGWQGKRHAGYPEPRLGKNATAKPKPSLLEAIRAVRPGVPSVSGLTEGVAVPIPGLENVEGTYAPTMTGDMLTIVFSKQTDSPTGYDLQIANRGKAEEAFGQIAPLEICNSQFTDSFPALSPDGLELMFIRFDPLPQLLYTSRETRAGVFEDPRALEIPPPASGDLVIGDPQFVDALAIKYLFRAEGGTARDVFYSRRKTAGGPFDAPRKLLYADCGAPQFLSADGLRSYYGWEQGLFLAARQSAGDSFERPVQVLDAKVTGEVDGPVWVAPREDVIVYCSPGSGQQRESPRRLWMVRY